MDSFQFKILEQVLYSRVPLTPEQIDAAMPLFVKENPNTWSSSSMLQCRTPNGKLLRIAKLLLPHLAATAHTSPAIQLFKFKMHSAYGRNY